MLHHLLNTATKFLGESPAASQQREPCMQVAALESNKFVNKMGMMNPARTGIQLPMCFFTDAAERVVWDAGLDKLGLSTR